MVNKNAAPDAKKPTGAEVLRLAGTGYNMDLLKADIANMEKDERQKLLVGIKDQRDIISVNLDIEQTRRLTQLEEMVAYAEKSFGDKAAEAIGSGVDKMGTVVNQAIDIGAEGVKGAANVVTDQAKKATDAVVQIGAQVSEVLEDPNRSKTEKAVHIAGLAAVVGVPAYLLYKLCKNMSGDEVKDGDKPSLGRKLLKWTGFAFLGGLGVRALAPMLSETQRGVMVQQKEEEEARKRDALRTPFDRAPELEIGGQKVRIWKEGNDFKIAVGDKKFGMRMQLDPGVVLTDMKYDSNKGMIIEGKYGIIPGSQTIPVARCEDMVNKLHGGETRQEVTVLGYSGKLEKYPVDFVPETPSI